MGAQLARQLEEISKIEDRLGEGILDAERNLLAIWRDALEYVDSLEKNPVINEDEALELTRKATTNFGIYQLYRPVPDPMIVATHAVVSEALKAIFLQAAIQDFDDDISPEFLEIMEKNYG